LGSTILVLQDPGAITHLYSKDTSTYHQSGFIKAILRNMMGDVVLISEGETHKRFILMMTSCPTDVY